MKRNMKRWIADLVGGRERKVLPIMTSPGIDLIGAAPSDVFRQGKLHYEAVKALSEKFPMAAALTMMDSFGCQPIGRRCSHSVLNMK